jgi:serine/threonine protein phosphatase 1
MPDPTDGRRLYAVGDIHGRADLLDRMIRAIAADLDAQGAPRTPPPMIVFLGDYVDRGPSSREVIDRVIALGSHCEVRALKGNHEEALLQFLADPEFGPEWITHGGAQTLSSYGVEPPRFRTDLEAWKEAHAAFEAALPAAHRAFLETLPAIWVVGAYAFTHAGVRPGVPLADQTEHDLMWIRREFLDFEGPHPKVIVHGHTPSEAPQVTPYRIGLDTGAYATGVLTAMGFHGKARRLFQVTPTGVTSEPAATPVPEVRPERPRLRLPVAWLRR